MSTQVTLSGGEFDGQVVDWPDGTTTDALTGTDGAVSTYTLDADDPTKATFTSVVAAAVPATPTPTPAPATPSPTPAPTPVSLYGGAFDGQVVDWPDATTVLILDDGSGNRLTYALSSNPTVADLTAVNASAPAEQVFVAGTPIQQPNGTPLAVWMTAAAPAVTPPPILPTPLEFMARLTPAEQTAIATAGQSNASVLLFLLKLAGATYVDATDPATTGGLDAMVAAGLLTAARGAQILNYAVTSP